MSAITVAALYQFKPLTDLPGLQHSVLSLSLELGLKGTILLASEGINGTVAGSPDAIDQLQLFLEQAGFTQLEYKTASCTNRPFYRMKVKIKPEIVTLGLAHIDPTVCVGRYVEPQQWNALIQNPDVFVLDTRNEYECRIGTFKGAVNPNTQHFRNFPAFAKQHINPQVHKQVAMFCTGGIRCEKASSYLLSELKIQEVYHLRGGILNYLEKIPAADSLWRGECFVFDNRVAVNHDLAPGQYDLCHGCRSPITAADKRSDKYVPGVSCGYCYDTLTDMQKQRFAQRQKQMQLARERGQQHLGCDPKQSLAQTSVRNGFDIA